MRKLFVSYARENKRDVDDLVAHLETMGYQTWVDVSLRGGQDWWEEILRRIADTDVLITIVSRAVLNSTACQREFEWAQALGKPILPVAVEPTEGLLLPQRLAKLQIIDYSKPQERDRAALLVQRGLGTLPAAPPLPDPMPETPGAPLSYLTDIVDIVTQATPLDQDRQREILLRLEPALSAVDPAERQAGRDILERFAQRADLYADVYRGIVRLQGQPVQPAPVANVRPEAPAPDPTPRTTGPIPEPPAVAPVVVPHRAASHGPVPQGAPPTTQPRPAHASLPSRTGTGARGRRVLWAALAAAVLALPIVIGAVAFFLSQDDKRGGGCAGALTAWQDVARIAYAQNGNTTDYRLEELRPRMSPQAYADFATAMRDRDRYSPPNISGLTTAVSSCAGDRAVLTSEFAVAQGEGSLYWTYTAITMTKRSDGTWTVQQAVGSSQSRA